MKPASQLSDPEAQILCAEVLGWRPGADPFWTDPNGELWHGLPNWPTNLQDCQSLIDYMRERGLRLNCGQDLQDMYVCWFSSPIEDTYAGTATTEARARVNAFLVANQKALP